MSQLISFQWLDAPIPEANLPENMAYTPTKKTINTPTRNTRAQGDLRTYYANCKKGENLYKLKDVVRLETGQLGIVKAMWQDKFDRKMVRVRWLYTPEETKRTRKRKN